LSNEFTDAGCSVSRLNQKNPDAMFLRMVREASAAFDQKTAGQKKPEQVRLFSWLGAVIQNVN
jgi:hypothetical protein